MKKKYLIFAGAALALGAIAVFSSCQTMPKGAKPVKSFDKAKYLGKWYEIARFDYRYEKNLINTTAEYSLNEDESIQVVNRGYNTKKDKQVEAKGKAKFVGATDEAKLKVSFFGPFYAGYNVIAIDDDYRYALVAGRNLDYLWFLSRETTMPESVKQAYLEKAKALGYDVGKLVWVKH